MRVTIRLLGAEVFDIAFNEPEPEVEAEFEPYQDAGTTGSYAIGFAPTPAPPWEDPGSLHQFDPEPDGENP